MILPTAEEVCSAPSFATLPVSIAGTLAIALAFGWAIQRSVRAGTSPVMLALLVAVMPLQRFGLQVGGSQLPLALVLALLTIMVGVLRGDLRFDPIRSLVVAITLTAVAAVTTYGISGQMSALSLAMLGSIYIPYMLAWPCQTSDYQKIVFSFQDLALVSAIIGVVQFLGQFPLGIPAVFPLDSFFPSSLLIRNFCQYRELSSGIMKASGNVFLEPSIFAQTLAWALLLEILFMGMRPFYLVAYSTGLALSFGGTGIALAAMALPFALAARRRWDLIGIGVAGVVVCLFGLLMIDFRFDDALRIEEFANPYSSGYARFVGPFRMVEELLSLDSESMWHGFGSGTITDLIASMPYQASDPTWVKAVVEYGIVAGPLLVVTVCVFGLAIPPRGAAVLSIAAIFQYLVMNGYLLTFTFHVLAWVILVWPRPPKRALENRTAG